MFVYVSSDCAGLAVPA